MTLPGLMVVGTDTGVGKTLVAAAIAGSLVAGGRRVGVLKPVATGARLAATGWRCGDAEKLIAAVGGGLPLERVAPILFEEPLAPPVAARRAGRELDRDRVDRAVRDALDWWSTRAEVMVVEGIGGLLCPLAEETTVADLAVALDYPLVVVARRGLGTLNHTLLTVEAARRRALRIAGLVLNSPEPEAGSPAETSSGDELAVRLPGVAVLTELLHASEPELFDLVGAVDWYERAGIARWFPVLRPPGPAASAGPGDGD
jgi:dethiobiotin synthetase